MGDMHRDDECFLFKSANCSDSNNTSNSTYCPEKALIVQSETGSGGSCTVEPTNFYDKSCISTSVGCSVERSVCSSTGLPLAKPLTTSLYRQDVVQCTQYEGLVGMVTKVAGDTESDSSSSDSEDQDENESISEGYVRIVWTNLSETTEKINDILVIDRGFLHGDIVAAVSDPSGQTGTVVNVNLSVDLLGSNLETIKNVSSRNLQRVRAFAVGDYVIHGPWLGRVDEVVDNVTVQFDDGSKCKVMKADPERLTPVYKNLLEDAPYPYHPGQLVRATSSAVFKSARWLRGTWKANRVEGIVSNVEAGSVYVYWIAAANPGYNPQSTTIPAEQQDPKQLKLLACFSYANWQLGDWCLLPMIGRRMAECTETAIEDAVSDGDAETSIDNASLAVLNLGSSDVSGTIETAHESWFKDTETPVGNGTLPTLESDGKNSLGSEQAMHETWDGYTETPDDTNILLAVNSGSTTVSSSKDTMHDNAVKARKKFRKCLIRHDRKAHRKDDVVEGALLVVNTRTKVDVIWQDGTRASGLDSRTLIPVDNLGDHDFYPEQYVLDKVSEEDGLVSEVRRVGIVKSVDSRDRTARVRWLKPVARPEDTREFDNEEVVSVYELDEHPDYNYCIGDIVIRLSPVPKASATPGGCGHKMRPENDAESIKTSSDQKPLEKRLKAEDGGSFDSSELSWIGTITGLYDGDIEVAWADGMVSKLGPQAIFVVGRDEDDSSIQSNSEEDDSASWETVNSDGLDTLDQDEESEQLGQDTECVLYESAMDSDHDKKNVVHPEENLNQQSGGSLSIPRAAFGFVARFATGLLGFRGSRKRSDTSTSSSQGWWATQKHGPEGILDVTEVDKVEGEELKEGSQCHLPEPNTNMSDTMHTPGVSAIVAADKEGEDLKNDSRCTDSKGHDQLMSLQNNVEFSAGVHLSESMLTKTVVVQTQENIMPSISVSGDHDLRHFKHFDSVNDPLDHYFLNETGQPFNERKWTKKVQQDWNILEKNLPDTIYVRIYEDRMDLLRAVITGAAGTPYQYGLFFFDIHLPPEYPHTPPSAYYHSGGLRLNPNLYETGKVCLSLLNTWTGRGNEVWDPTSSSILQVLVSLQGLVLNAKPYYNEAGYDKQIGSVEGEKNSLAYNENTFLLSCKSMLYILRRPPKHFEMFVKQHFQNYGKYILRACDEYMNGAQVGSLSGDASLPSDAGIDSLNTSSAGFRLMLGKIIPKLVSAFSELGIVSC